MLHRGSAGTVALVAPEQLARFLEFVPDGSVVVGEDGLIEFANAHTEALFGYTPEELVGQPLDALVPERFRSGHPGHRADYFANPRTRPMGAQLELYAQRKDGSEFPAEISLSTVAAGDRLLAIAAVRDVTARVEAQRTLQQFLEFAPDGIVGVGADGRIALANAQTEALFGYPRAELLGQPVEVLVPERFHDAHPGHRATYFDDPGTRPMGAKLQLFGRRRDGSEFPAEISLSSIASDGGVMAIAAIRDITDRVRLERELDQSRRAEAKREREGLEAQLNQLRRLESVGQLAGGVAHDFNNLLGVIIGYAQFVGDEIGESSPAFEDVGEIRRAAERGAALTRQLLIFSRREVVRPQVLDLNAVLTEMDRLLRRALGEHVELETRPGADLCSIKADPGQIEQVLVNLAVNARDAMPGGGRLLIETTNVELDDAADAPPGRYVRLAVSDTGDGMSPEVLAHVFEPFFSTKPRGQGTGLGLTTVYGIVTEADGHITLYSEPGIGTTVKVHLPASTQAPTRAGEPERRPDGGHGETVLVVEDEPGVRRLSERILKQAGYRVLVASGGKEALKLLAQADQPVDLLLSDVVMPEMQGPELAERATTIRPDLKVVFMSGYVHQVIAGQDPLPAVPFEFIEKPFTADRLIAGVRSALDSARSA